MRCERETGVEINTVDPDCASCLPLQVELRLRFMIDGTGSDSESLNKSKKVMSGTPLLLDSISVSFRVSKIVSMLCLIL